jgi:hypothetical protein
MTITVPLEPKEEARLIAAARAKGVSPVTLVREAIDQFLAGAPNRMEEPDLDLHPGSAERYARLKEEMVASGVPLLNDDELRAEIRERKGVKADQEQ